MGSTLTCGWTDGKTNNQNPLEATPPTTVLGTVSPIVVLTPPRPVFLRWVSATVSRVSGAEWPCTDELLGLAGPATARWNLQLSYFS